MSRSKKRRDKGHPAAGPVIVTRADGTVSEEEARRPSKGARPNAQLAFGTRTQAYRAKTQARQNPGYKVGRPERSPKWWKPRPVPKRSEPPVEPLDVTPDATTGFVPKYLRSAVRDKQGRLRNPRDWRDETRDPFA